jgi:hypothetical protein
VKTAVQDRPQKNEYIEIHSKAAILKQYELLCYQVCYYLLGCETKAHKASLASMECLFGDSLFYGQEEPDRLKTVRKTAMHYSLSMLH